MFVCLFADLANEDGEDRDAGVVQAVGDLDGVVVFFLHGTHVDRRSADKT